MTKHESAITVAGAHPSRIERPLIEHPWQRDAILAIVDHWKRNADYNGTKRRAAKSARRLLWLLPESRHGRPIRNPISGRPATRPKRPRSLQDAVWECIGWDHEVLRIFRKHDPEPKQTGTTACVVCIGTGWMPDRHGGRRDCRDCNGRGEVA